MSPLPDERGRFGPFGGRYVPETLLPVLDELEAAYRQARADPSFTTGLARELAAYAGRPSPLTYVPRFSERCGKGRVYLKREDLNHTGSHKLNNTIGQGLLAVRMGKKRVIAETGAGQHGVAVATACARLDRECVVYMGAEDVRRQALNVYRMQLLGAELRQVDSGSRTLKDAINEALRDWITNVAGTYYLLGSTVGPHPFPELVRDFQSVIGLESRRQVLEAEGRLPDRLVACVGGGSNAMGLFHPFLDDEGVAMTGVEAAGEGLASGRHSASLCAGAPGVLHGARTYLLADDDGQILPAHSVSAGLDYPGVGPEHAWLKETGRVEYTAVGDEAALAALEILARSEGILCALESAHALAHLLESGTRASEVVVVCLSGRGDKDVDIVRERAAHAE